MMGSIIFKKRLIIKNFTRFNIAVIDIDKTFKEDELNHLKLQQVKKSTILYGDDKNPILVIVKNGKAKLSIIDSGKEFIIFRIIKNNLVVLNQMVTLEFVEDSEIYMIEADKFIYFNKNLKNIYNQALLNIIFAQRRIIQEILFENLEGKIARFILELVKEQNLTQNGYELFIMPFSITVLSSFIGVERQSASRAFNKLIKDGTISKIAPNQYIIKDKQKLISYTTI